jgi:ribosomal protein S18 acetylase RimI-like enzyme
VLSYSHRQLKYLLTTAKSSCLVETADQIIRGFIIILYRKQSSVAAIETLDVDPSFQGKGIGQRLLKAGEDVMLASGVKSMRLEVSTNNLSALHLYEKAGYRIVAFLPCFYSNQHYGTRDAFRMVKKLA